MAKSKKVLETAVPGSTTSVNPKSESVISNILENPTAETVLQITELELAKMMLHRARMDVQITVRENLQLKESELARKYNDERSMLRGKQLDVTRSLEEAQKDYNDVLRLINGRLGINMLEYIVRDDGVLFKADSV